MNAAIVFVELDVAVNRSTAASLTVAQCSQCLVLLLQFDDKIERVADDAQLLEHHVGADLFAHLGFGLAEPLLVALALCVALGSSASACLIVVGWAERRSKLSFKEVLTLLSTGGDDVLQGDKLFVDLFSSASLDDRVVRLASKYARLATCAVLVEELLASIDVFCCGRL